jgi:hypothetical protein
MVVLYLASILHKCAKEKDVTMKCFYFTLLLLVGNLLAQSQEIESGDKGFFLSAELGLSSLDISAAGSLNYYSDSRILSLRIQEDQTFRILDFNWGHQKVALEYGVADKDDNRLVFLSGGPAWVTGTRKGPKLESSGWFSFGDNYERIPVKEWGASFSAGVKFMAFNTLGLGVSTSLTASKHCHSGALMLSASIGSL